jgi:hypothetical protein
MMQWIDDILRVSTAIGALGAVILGIINSRKITSIHISINSRMDQYLSLRGEASKAEGVMQGMMQERGESRDRDIADQSSKQL